jgi:hypothetical protein
VSTFVGANPAANAAARITVLVLTATGPLYNVPVVSVGTVPFRV